METQQPRRPHEMRLIIEWIKAHFPLNQKVPASREAIVTESGVSLSYVGKAFLVLEEKGFIDYDKRRGELSYYTLLKDIAEISAEQLSGWVIERQRVITKKYNETKRAKKATDRKQEPAFPILESGYKTTTVSPIQTEEVVSKQPETMPEQSQPMTLTETLPAQPLTPIQQLLQEVQALAAAEEKRKNEPVLPTEDLTQLKARIESAESKLSRLDQMEKKVNTLLFFFQQAGHALKGLPPIQLPVDNNTIADLPALETSTRTKIVRLVDGYVSAKVVTHQEVWKHLYGQLSARCHFDAWVYGQGKKDPNYLEIVEEHGQLENLYAIAQEMLSVSIS